MTIFWILAAGLLGLALLFVVPPLLTRRSTEDIAQDDLNLALFRQQLAELDSDLAAGRLERSQYDAARRDLERELLYDIDAETQDHAARAGGQWVAAVLAVALPVGAVGLYLQLGETDIIPRLEAQARGGSGADTAHAAGAEDLPPIGALIERLAERLEASPDDVQGWLMLGRSYFALEQPAKARDALARAYELAPKDPEVLVAYAQALAAANNGRLSGRPAELIREATALDPDNLTAQWLGGLLAFQRSDFAEAIRTWERILPQLDPEGEEAAQLRQSIAEAQKHAGSLAATQGQPQGPGTANQDPLATPSGSDTARRSPEAGSGEEDGTATAGRIRIDVRLDEALWYEAAADDTLFVYAKAVDGPPMPLAVTRARVGDLPLTLTLDDSQAMTPQLRLSQFDEVLVGARISASGQATPQSGDLEGEAGPVTPGDEEPLPLVIDQQRP